MLKWPKLLKYCKRVMLSYARGVSLRIDFDRFGGHDRTFPPAHRTNQEAGFAEFLPIVNSEK